MDEKRGVVKVVCKQKDSTTLTLRDTQTCQALKLLPGNVAQVALIIKLKYMYSNSRLMSGVNAESTCSQSSSTAG
jgi:hypothetical protein